MPLIRLIGLTLFITAIFLALIAAITQTTHIEVQIPGFSNSPASPSDGALGEGRPNQFGSMPSVPPRQGDLGSGLVLPPNSGAMVGEALFDNSANAGGAFSQSQGDVVGFTSVPIIWPLIIAAGLGLLMWFMHPGEPLRVAQNARKRRPRRRKK